MAETHYGEWSQSGSNPSAFMPCNFLSSFQGGVGMGRGGMQMPRWELWVFLWGQLDKVFWGLCWCLWENSHGNFGKDWYLQALVIHKHLTGPWGCFLPVVWNVGKICGWSDAPWTDSLLRWLSLGHSGLLSWGKGHWWDQQPSDKAGDNRGVMELPCAPSWAWGSSQGPAQHQAQLDPRRLSASSQVCGRPFTARDCSQWIVPALLQSVCWRNKPLNPCQFTGSGSEVIKN